MIQLNIDELCRTDRRLYSVLTRLGAFPRGTINFDENKLNAGNIGALEEWMEAHPLQPPAPATPSEPLIDMEALKEEERRDIQTRADEALAKRRLEQFCVEQGLARTPENVEKIQSWLDKNVRGYWSQQGVDAAVVALGARGTNELTWDPLPPPPAPPVPEPEAPRVLSNGEPELPLDASVQVMRHASLVQLRDLDRRQHGVRRPQGSFGSKFI